MPMPVFIPGKPPAMTPFGVFLCFLILVLVVLGGFVYRRRQMSGRWPWEVRPRP